MSNAHDSHAHAPSNEDDVNIKKIVMIGAISLVIFFISAVIAYYILKVDTATLQAAGVAKPGKLIGQPEIGIVDQVPFDIDHRLEDWRAAKHKHLTSFGWVDRAQGKIHVPIDQAMDEFIKRSAGGAQP